MYQYESLFFGKYSFIEFFRSLYFQLFLLFIWFTTGTIITCTLGTSTFRVVTVLHDFLKMEIKKNIQQKTIFLLTCVETFLSRMNNSTICIFMRKNIQLSNIIASKFQIIITLIDTKIVVNSGETLNLHRKRNG